MNDKETTTVKLTREQILHLLSVVKYSENPELMGKLRVGLYDINAQKAGMMCGRQCGTTCGDCDDDNILVPNDPVDW
jgi:hypothetical protein